MEPPVVLGDSDNGGNASIPQVDDVVERRFAGAAIAELAEHFGIHRTTVMAYLRRRAATLR